MSLNENIERTEVIRGIESVIGTELHFFSKAKTRIDTCMDSTRPALAVRIEPIRKSFATAKRNGGGDILPKLQMIIYLHAKR